MMTTTLWGKSHRERLRARTEHLLTLVIHQKEKRVETKAESEVGFCWISYRLKLKSAPRVSIFIKKQRIGILASPRLPLPLPETTADPHPQTHQFLVGSPSYKMVI